MAEEKITCSRVFYTTFRQFLNGMLKIYTLYAEDHSIFYLSLTKLNWGALSYWTQIFFHSVISSIKKENSKISKGRYPNQIIIPGFLKARIVTIYLMYINIKLAAQSSNTLFFILSSLSLHVRTYSDGRSVSWKSQWHIGLVTGIKAPSGAV